MFTRTFRCSDLASMKWSTSMAEDRTPERTSWPQQLQLCAEQLQLEMTIAQQSAATAAWVAESARARAAGLARVSRRWSPSRQTPSSRRCRGNTGNQATRGRMSSLSQHLIHDL